MRNLQISASSWQSLTSDLLLSNLRCVAGQIMRERDIYDFNGGFDLYEKNTGTCRDTLMNGHWEELFGKLEELLHATDDPDNYRMHIQYIIHFSSDGLQRLKSIREKAAGCDRGDVVIGYEWLCINPCQPPTTTTGRQGMVDIRVDKSSSNC